MVDRSSRCSELWHGRRTGMKSAVDGGMMHDHAIRNIEVSSLHRGRKYDTCI